VLNGAIVGFGKIAQTGHLPAYLDDGLGKVCRVVAVAEPNSEYRQRAAKLIDGVHVYESLEQLLSIEQPDFVDICTPPDRHASAISPCASRDIHILCEKPFAASLKEATGIEEVLTGKPNLVVMPCHQYRYSPLWMHFHETIEKWGGHSRFLLQFNVYRTQPDPAYLVGNPNWRADRRVSGGGILVDTGVHYIYLALWMLGTPISISARTTRLHHEFEVEDTALVCIECERGMAQINLTWAAGQRANSARLTHEKGSLAYDGSSLVRTIGDQSEILPVPDASDKSTYVKLYVLLIQEFVERISDGRGSGGWLGEARNTVAILGACYESAARGTSVRVDSVGSESTLFESRG
jgi:predicted dehydrogenase